MAARYFLRLAVDFLAVVVLVVDFLAADFLAVLADFRCAAGLARLDVVAFTAFLTFAAARI